uniref:Uncharacterized protein n=1 Tax=virus sp. ctn3M15 TaxID=2825821 RepID=A0A8S5RL60_9VIRU|nr:MAG TPA: hypothetical protein [virus sp. ctn3M15]
MPLLIGFGGWGGVRLCVYITSLYEVVQEIFENIFIIFAPFLHLFF